MARYSILIQIFGKSKITKNIVLYNDCNTE